MPVYLPVFWILASPLARQARFGIEIAESEEINKRRAASLERRSRQETRGEEQVRLKRSILLIAVALVWCVAAQADVITLYTPPAGDAVWAWNSKYGPYGYTTGGTTMGVGLYIGAPYGNDYTISIFEVPIAELAGKPVTSATLVVDSLGFGTGYWYGSASIGWLNTGNAVLTGDVVADNLGPASQGCPGGFQIYNSDYPDTPGLKYFNVLTHVQADLAAGRAFSTFVMSGSRDTYGAIYTAESGRGPYIVAVVPEPTTISMLGLGLAGMLLRRRRKA